MYSDNICIIYKVEKLFFYSVVSCELLSFLLDESGKMIWKCQ